MAYVHGDILAQVLHHYQEFPTPLVVLSISRIMPLSDLFYCQTFE